MHRISHRPWAACSSIHQHRCCESSDRSPQPRQVSMQMRQMQHTSHVALDPIKWKRWLSRAWKCPLTVDPQRPRGSCFSAEAICHVGCICICVYGSIQERCKMTLVIQRCKYSTGRLWSDLFWRTKKLFQNKHVCGLREASSSIDLTASDGLPPFQKVHFNKL